MTSNIFSKSQIGSGPKLENYQCHKAKVPKKASMHYFQAASYEVTYRYLSITCTCKIVTEGGSNQPKKLKPGSHPTHVVPKRVR